MTVSAAITVDNLSLAEWQKRANFDGFSFFAGCRRIAVRFRRIATKYFS
jgi:hypothetical protein